MSELEHAVAAHYDVNDLLKKIDAGLAALGVAPGEATVEALAPVDEFHTAGRITTLKAIELSDIGKGGTLLDAGSGIGGTARALAEELDATVTGVDLTPVYVETATALSERMGFGERTSFVTGSVTDLRFDDASFDGAFTFHVGMNVPDRPAFYAEVARALKPGGVFCLFDVMKGPAPGMLYPVPWAEAEATSFLKTPDEMRAYLAEAGLTVEKAESLKDFAAEFFRKAFAAAAKADGPPPLGLHLLTGANAPQKFQNYAAALDADQIDPVIMVARKG